MVAGPSQGPQHAIGCPLAGRWVAVNTPARRIPSHGTDGFGQRYAFDFARLNDRGSGLSSRPRWQQLLVLVPARAFPAWEQPVLCAFPGVVLAAEDGWADRLWINACWERIRARVLQGNPEPGDLRPLFGNHVLVQGEVGVALYAHLRRGSLRVRPGDRIQEGQELGRVGNSGNSTLPHLHFHVMDRPDPWQAQGIYCGFRSPEPGADPFVPRPMEPFEAGPLGCARCESP